MHNDGCAHWTPHLQLGAYEHLWRCSYSHWSPCSEQVVVLQSDFKRFFFVISISAGMAYYNRYPVYDSPQDPHHGWSARHPLELIARTVLIHGVLLLNYIHLQETQKVRYTNRTVRVLRFVLFTFMPTLVIAELFLNLCRTFLLFLQSDPSKMVLEDAVNNGKRYLCGLAGMHVVPRPGVEQSDAVEAGTTSHVEGDAEVEPITTAEPNHYAPRLCKIKDSNDLEQHDQPWNLKIIGRIWILVIPILQAVGTIVLFARRLDSGWHDPGELDKRNFVAAHSNIACSLASIIIILCRSEWSLKILNSSNTRQTDYVVRTFFLEFILASVLNEAPYAALWRVLPFSWIVMVADLIGVGGIVILVILGLFIWFLVWAFDEKIRQSVQINWHFVLGIPMVIISIWIVVDLVAYFVVDIIQLAGNADGIWDKDPVSYFLLIC